MFLLVAPEARQNIDQIYHFVFFGFINDKCSWPGVDGVWRCTHNTSFSSQLTNLYNGLVLHHTKERLTSDEHSSLLALFKATNKIEFCEIVNVALVIFIDRLRERALKIFASVGWAGLH
jgi:hypothetical protein